MLSEAIADLKTFTSKDLDLLARYYKINTNLVREKLIEKIAEKITFDSKWNQYCQKEYIPNVIENTRIQLLKDITTGKGICQLIRDLPRIGKSSSTAKIYDYNPTPKTAAVIKITSASQKNAKDLNLMQLLSEYETFPYVFMSGRCGSRQYTVMEKLGPTLSDLIEQRVATSTLKKVIREVLDGIAVMMDLGIVHTDLKPDNIMLRCTGPNSYQTVIIDFDLVNNPNREIDKYPLFDVYDFMRRLHNLSVLERLYPALHKQITKLYLQLRDNKSNIRNPELYKRFFV